MSTLLNLLRSGEIDRPREEARARLRIDVAESLLILMEDVGISKAEMAKAIGVSRSAISQALTGERNMTLNTIADIARALGREVRFDLQESLNEPRGVTPAAWYFGSADYLKGTQPVTSFVASNAASVAFEQVVSSSASAMPAII